MSGSIRVSRKHGVNPSLGTCFWCGEADTVVLMGRLPGDAEAPRKVVLNYDPCPKCKELWKQGVVLIEVDSKPVREGQAPLGGPDSPHYPTGSHSVIKADAIRKILNPKILAEQAISRGMAIMDRDTYRDTYQALIHPHKGHTEEVPAGDKTSELPTTQPDSAGSDDRRGDISADDAATGAGAAPERRDEEPAQSPAARPQQQSGEAGAPEAGQETEAPAPSSGAEE